MIEKWFTDEDEESAKSIIGDCPREILQMVAALVNLDITTRNHAIDLDAEGWIGKAEEATARANRYRESINALVEIWGEPVTYEPSALDELLVYSMREIRRKCPTCGEDKMKIGGECEGCGTIHSI